MPGAGEPVVALVPWMASGTWEAWVGPRWCTSPTSASFLVGVGAGGGLMLIRAGEVRAPARRKLAQKATLVFRIRLINRDLGKDLSRTIEVKAGQLNVVKHDFLAD